MFQKFFTNTIESKFIKQLLATTPLPIYRTIKYGDFMLKDCYYIYLDSIIKCTTTGYFTGDRALVIGAEKPVVSDDLLVRGEVGSFEVIDNFYFGTHYPKYTTYFTSTEPFMIQQLIRF